MLLSFECYDEAVLSCFLDEEFCKLRWLRCGGVIYAAYSALGLFILDEARLTNGLSILALNN